MTTRSWLVFAGMMVGLVAMFVVYGITRDPRATSSVKPEIIRAKGDTVRVAVETVLKGYEKDAGKADRAFKYRICEVSGVVDDIDVAQGGVAEIRFLQSRQRSHQRGLARSIGAQKTEHAVGDFERDVVQRLNAVSISLGEIFDTEHGGPHKRYLANFNAK